jgi:hypothetical protein
MLKKILAGQAINQSKFFLDHKQKAEMKMKDLGLNLAVKFICPFKSRTLNFLSAVKT